MILKKIKESHFDLDESISDEVLKKLSDNFSATYTRSSKGDLRIVDFKFENDNDMNNMIKFLDGSVPSVHSDNTLILEIEDSDPNKSIIEDLLEGK